MVHRQLRGSTDRKRCDTDASPPILTSLSTTASKLSPCHDLIAGPRKVGPDVVDAKRDAHGLKTLPDTNHARGLTDGHRHRDQACQARTFISLILSAA